MADTAAPPDIKCHGPDLRLIWLVTLATGVIAAAVFLIWPWIDQAVAAIFLQADGRYILKGNEMGRALRLAFKALFAIGAGVALIALIISYFQKRRVLGHGRRKWLYLLACLVIGPGLVANVVFKDNWGRARPVHVSDQGRSFTPPLIISDQCERNCSFVSGEAASIYALFFGLSLMGSIWWRALLSSALLLGSAAGLMRMAQGGHYLSDVIFSGVFMTLTALVLHWIFFRREHASSGTKHDE